MKPRLLNLAAGVSLLLSIAIVVLCVRSYGHCDVVSRAWRTTTQRRAQVVVSWWGEVSLQTHDALSNGPQNGTTYSYEHLTPVHEKSHWLPFPPVWFERHRNAVYNDQELGIAYWLLLLLMLPLPLVAIVRPRHHEMNNLCPTCGYDLRATPDRCPECGLRQALFEHELQSRMQSSGTVPASSVVREQSA